MFAFENLPSKFFQLIPIYFKVLFTINRRGKEKYNCIIRYLLFREREREKKKIEDWFIFTSNLNGVSIRFMYIFLFFILGSVDFLKRFSGRWYFSLSIRISNSTILYQNNNNKKNIFIESPLKSKVALDFIISFFSVEFLDCKNSMYTVRFIA